MSRRSRPTPSRAATCVLALDVSSSCTGWSIFKAGRPVAHGKYPLPGDDHGTKLVAFQDWLLELLLEWQPDAVAIEQPYPGHRRNAFGVLMMYFGTVLATHVRYFGYPLPADGKVTAADVKRLVDAPKAATYEGRKAAMVKIINARFGLNLSAATGTQAGVKRSDDDIADAIAVNAAYHRRREVA